MRQHDFSKLAQHLTQVERLAGDIAAQPAIPLDIWSIRKIEKQAREIGEHSRRARALLDKLTHEMDIDSDNQGEL